MLRRLVVSAPFLVLAFLPAAAQQSTVQSPMPAQPPQTVPAVRPKPKFVKPKEIKKPTPPVDAATGQKARLLEKIRDWTVFIYEGVEGRVCFAATAPTDMQPKTAKRTPVIFYVTTWQKDGVRNEVSVKQGYAMKANSPASVTIGTQHFTLSPDEDKVFVKDATDERKLIGAMSAGGPMSVKATSGKGTSTTDQYSLDGLADAIKKLQEACP